MRQTPKSERFRRFKTGDSPSSAHENQQSAALERMSSPLQESGATRPFIKFMRMDDVLGQFGPSDAEYYNRDAVTQYFDDYNDHKLHDTSPEDRRRTLTNPWPACPFDRDQIVLCVQMAQAGVYMPVAPVTVRHAVTVMDGDGTYPDCESEPNVYPIKFTNLDWTKAAGRQSVTTTYLDTYDGLPDDYVLNIYEGETSYLPLGTPIQVYFLVDRWYTSTCCGEVCESSSSSSQSISSSFSSASASSSSSSSQSSSSASSTSSSSRSSVSASSPSSSSESSSGSQSSQSVSESSSASSLSASSASSVSASSASSVSASSASSVSNSASSASSESFSASSASMSLSGNVTCVTLLSSVSFNAGTCTLTYCTRTICFPANLNITIGPESC